jgi:ribosomal protein S18 acetylase RimI-like enzyme
MTLVPFDPTHAATVADWPTSAVEALRWCGHSEFPLSPAAVASWSDDPEVRAFLLMAGSTPIAYGELWLDETEVELARLIVAPAHRDQGNGRRLVEALAELAREHDTGLICLRVHPGNDGAARLYRKIGFQPVDEPTATEWNADQPVKYQWLTLVPE